MVAGTISEEALGGCDGMVAFADGTVATVAYLPDGTEIPCVPTTTSAGMGATGMGAVPLAVALAPFVVKVIGYTIAAIVVMKVYRLTADRLSQYFGVNADLQDEAAGAAQVAYEEALATCSEIQDPAARARCLGDAEQSFLDALARINREFAGRSSRVMGMVLVVGALGLGAAALSKR